jgi:polyhydroxyalkanoate synthase
MGASGHIAGVINPPAKNKRCYWTREDGKLPATPRRMVCRCQRAPGQLVDRLVQLAGQQCGQANPAPKTYGKGKYKAIEPAPGRYVKVKA